MRWNTNQMQLRPGCTAGPELRPGLGNLCDVIGRCDGPVISHAVDLDKLVHTHNLAAAAANGNCNRRGLLE